MANPRGRPKKIKDANSLTNNTQSSQSIQSTESQMVEQEQYARQFAKTMQSALGSSYLFNPIWQNETLKNINMSPAYYTRDKVEELVTNPRQNEKALRNLSQYLFNFITQYKQLITYYSALLSFDYYIVPMNADEEDIKSKPFLKSYNKALNWLEDFNLKSQLPDISRSMMLEDAKFYYLRDSKHGTILQEMPQDYCIISSKNELGYQYSFNMMYFLRPNINFDDFAPEFKEYFDDFILNKDSAVKKAGVKKETKGSTFYYWQELDPSKAWTFKYDENYAGIAPPFMGLFVDAIEISTYKKLLKTKTALDITQVILNKIPLADNAGKGATKKDDFAILADTAAVFSTIMQAAMPQGIKVMTSPLEAELFNFKQTETKDSIVGLGNQEFWEGSGASRIFGEAGLKGNGMEASLKTDANFVKHLYRKFERFLTFQLKQVTGKYRFRLVLEGTEFDREERFERAMKMVALGGSITYAAVAMGKSAEEFNSLLMLEGVLGLKKRMIPPVSMHTQNGSGGAPNKPASQISESGQDTIDNASNDNR